MFVFCFPSSGSGGVQSLIIRIAKHANLANERIKLVDRKDGYIKNQLVLQGVDFVFIHYEQKAILANINPDDTYISTFHKIKYDLRLFYPTNCKVLFWQVFPSSIDDIFMTQSSIRKLLLHQAFFNRFLAAKFVELINDSNGYFVMSGSMVVEKPYYKRLTSLPKILPIPVDVPKICERPRQRTSPSFSVCYIGRDVAWKNNSLLRVVKDMCNDIAGKYTLTIITDDVKSVKKLISGSGLNINFSIVYMENIGLEQLRYFLKSNVDIVFSMGTSLLESASIGIPSIIASASYNEIAVEKYYLFLNQSFDANLGFPDFVFKRNQGKYSFREVVDYIEKDKKIGERCYNYALKTHSVDEVYKELLLANHFNTLNTKKMFVFNNYFKLKVMLFQLYMRLFHDLFRTLKNRRLF